VQGKRKYYLNVCRPVNEVQDSGEMGCDALAAACETVVSENGTVRKTKVAPIWSTI